MKKNRNRFEVNIDDGEALLYTDRTRARQCLLNLLSNAAKFTSDGVVRFNAKVTHRSGIPWLEASVADTGIGIARPALHKIFDEFVQADTHTSTRYGGSGLGLAITRKLSILLGGTVSAQSEQGKGSVFFFEIPAHLPGAQPEATPSPDSTASTSWPLILVIDDDPNVPPLLTRILAKEKFRVESANTGMAGLEKARKLSPQGIVLDILLPDIDGFSVLARLKENGNTESIPVIMMSVQDEYGHGYQLGAADYLTKPIDRAILIRSLKRHCAPGVPGSILIVEDDEATRRLAEKILLEDGWRVWLAHDGAEALELIHREGKPSTILLDLMMDGMNGFEFLEEWRKVDPQKTVPVVVMTAKDLTAGDRARLNGRVTEMIAKSAYKFEDLGLELRKRLAQCGS